MNSRKKPAFRRSLTLGVLTRFIMTCVLFTLGSFVALYLGMFVCYLLPWNGGILYGILITIRDNVVFFMGLFLVCGKTLGYLGDVVRATEQIYKGGDGPVILPAALHDIENQMNQIKSDMLASRRAAEDAEKRKNDLVVYLAHDLKTPLTSVIGYLTLLQDEPELTAAQRVFRHHALFPHQRDAGAAERESQPDAGADRRRICAHAPRARAHLRSQRAARRHAKLRPGQITARL